MYQVQVEGKRDEGHAARTMRLHHCAISVPDVEASIAWYQEMLGFEVFWRTVIPGLAVTLVQMKGAGFLLELFQVPGAAPLPEGRSHPDTDFRTHGVKHFAIEVSDAREFVKELQAKGVRLVHVAEFEGTYGAFILDNSGNLIEIWQYL
jgi:catechol 2,3-dioxygenase-like lactoylglutathione lyase family enzyme